MGVASKMEAELSQLRAQMSKDAQQSKESASSLCSELGAAKAALSEKDAKLAKVEQEFKDSQAKAAKALSDLEAAKKKAQAEVEASKKQAKTELDKKCAALEASP